MVTLVPTGMVVVGDVSGATGVVEVVVVTTGIVVVVVMVTNGVVVTIGIVVVVCTGAGIFTP